MIKYKIEGQVVDREMFKAFYSDAMFLENWEAAISKKKDVIEQLNIAVVLKIIEGKFKVLTETPLLLQLFEEVNKSICIS